MESLDKHNSSPSFVRPFLYALNRMQANEILRPVQYMDRAKMLLIDRLGMSGPIPEAAFSHGVVGLMADHTHYFEGFALGLRLRQGVAVAIRSNDLQYHRLILEGTGDVQVSKEASYGDAELSSLLIHTVFDYSGVDFLLLLRVVVRVRQQHERRVRGVEEGLQGARASVRGPARMATDVQPARTRPRGGVVRERAAVRGPRRRDPRRRDQAHGRGRAEARRAGARVPEGGRRRARVRRDRDRSARLLQRAGAFCCAH